MFDCEELNSSGAVQMRPFLVHLVINSDYCSLDFEGSWAHPHFVAYCVVCELKVEALGSIPVPDWLNM